MVESNESGVAFDEQQLHREYSARAHLFKQLEGEAVFILTQELAVRDIKIHSISSRTKTFQSFLTKVRSKSYRLPFSDIEDFVGIRLTLLFLSDVDLVANLIREQFVVTSESDRISPEGSDEAFGYMSLHLVGGLPDSVHGPRYDALKGLPIEFQVRTILMDAWANVSHYLDYKNEQSIPSELRRDFMALSGLFFVADKHFQLFFDETVRSRFEAQRQVSEAADPDLLEIELNADTLAAYLQLRFPDRARVEAGPRSRLTEELSKFGVQTIADLNRCLTGIDDPLRRFEDSLDLERGVRFSQVAAVRLGLGLTDDKFASVHFSMSWIKEIRKVANP